MKILHIIRSVNSEGGGPIEGIKQLSKYKKQNGYFVEILSLDSPDALYIKDCPVKVHTVGPGTGSYGYSRKFIVWLLKHHQEYDVFVVNGIWQYHSFAARNVLNKVNRNYYIFTHGMLDPWFKHQYRLKHLKKLLYWRWGEYPVLRDAKRVFFTSEDEKILSRQTFSLYHCRETVVNYGTSGHQGNASDQRQLFLEHFPHLKNKPYLLYLSRIHPKKGVDLLIEAFAKSVNADSDLQLVIAGPDQTDWKIELDKIAEKYGISHKITWPGMLKGDIKWGAYLNAEAFVLPSHQENFGIVVAEALSCSLPVLISNKVNIWQEIIKDNAGLASDDNLAGTIDLLSRWQQLDTSSQNQIRENARNCFLQRFEITRASANLLNIFEKDLAAIKN
ncbi:MAG: transferase [Methylomonas sp.]|nr:MAG: transferase [Methylomonas sp.]